MNIANQWMNSLRIHRRDLGLGALALGAAEDHVPRSELAEPIPFGPFDVTLFVAARQDVDHRIDLKDPHSGIHFADRVNRFDAGANELSLHLVAAVLRERIENTALAAGP